MQIPVVGLDPSLSHWGISEGILDLNEGYLTPTNLLVVEPERMNTKTVRVNSNDLYISEQLAAKVIPACQAAKIVFVECPVGSQSARAMASYGVCVGILGAIRALGIPLIEVTASAVKKEFAGNKTASKQDMIKAGLTFYPEANWPRYEQNGKGFKKGDIHSKAEHVADGLGAIHAGVKTQEFTNLLRLFER